MRANWIDRSNWELYVTKIALRGYFWLAATSSPHSKVKKAPCVFTSGPGVHCGKSVGGEVKVSGSKPAAVANMLNSELKSAIR
jgi:hypothetical protein